MKTETQEIIKAFWLKTRGRLAHEHQARLKEPATNRLKEQVAERLGLPKDIAWDNLARHLKLMSDEERSQTLKGIVK